MDKNSPLLSVIVPIYNVEKYLDKCIKSIVEQSYKNLEVILVDDGSTDKSREICNVWREKDPRVRVIYKKNNGLVSARQTGLELASGEYIANVDSDDWIESDMYQSLMELAICNDSDLVTSGLIRDYENHSVIEEEKISAGTYTGEALYQLKKKVIDTDCFFNTRINMHITNKIFRKERLLKYQMDVPIEAKVGEDADVTYPYIFESRSISVSGKCFYHYVMRKDSIMGASITHNKSGEIMEDIFKKCIERNRHKIINIGEQLFQVITFFRCMSVPETLLQVDDKRIYPFEKVERGDKVILYGAGRFGKAVKRLLEEEKYCKIIAWADKVENEGIIPPWRIKDYKFDKLILAVINATVANDIEEMLIKLGIEKRVICRVKC